MLKSYDKKDELFPTQDEVQLQKHSIFENQLTNEQIQEIYMLLKSGQTLDGVTEIFKKRQVEQHARSASEKQVKQKNFDIYVILYSNIE